MIVARDLILAELTGTACTSCTSPPPAPSSSCARRRHAVSRSQPKPLLITSPSPTSRAPASIRSSRCIRRCAPTPTSPQSSVVSPTAPSTPSPPTTRRTRGDKERPFEEAPAGMLGLETSLPLTLTELVEPGVLSLADGSRSSRGGPPAIAFLADHGGRSCPAPPTLRDRPRRTSGGRRGRGSRAGRATRRSPAGSSPAGCVTRCARPTGRHRRRGPAMSR